MLKKVFLIIFLFSFSTFLFTSERAKTDKSKHCFFFTKNMINAFLEEYSEQEKIDIDKDMNIVRGIAFEKAKKTNKKPIYLATAGGPGARKSTILEKLLHKDPRFKNMVYIDPDQRTLKFMSNTYRKRSDSAYTIAKALARGKKYLEIKQNAYKKWRGASNYIALTLLEEALLNRNNIAQGATSTGEHMADFFTALKKNGYEIIIALCYADDKMRKKAIEYRNEVQTFYQSTWEDAILKGVLFPQRMQRYFKYANEMQLYWTKHHKSKKEKLAATIRDNKIIIHNEKALNAFINKYEKDRKNLEKSDGKIIPSWDSLCKARKLIITSAPLTNKNHGKDNITAATRDPNSEKKKNKN